MALTKCDDCGREISTKAETCPGCGALQFQAAEREELRRFEVAEMADPKAEHVIYNAMRDCLELISSISQRSQEVFSEPKNIFSQYEAMLTDALEHLEASEELAHSIVGNARQVSSCISKFGFKGLGNELEASLEEGISLYEGNCQSIEQNCRAMRTKLQDLPSFLHDYSVEAIPVFVETMLNVQAKLQTLIDTIAQMDKSGITPELAERFVQWVLQERRNWDESA